MDYTTSDNYSISIDKGGEQLPNNTYGFEIEFCTHDNPVFAFTHIDVATIGIKFHDEAEAWKIETDSGNVLELVTAPIRFENTLNAYAFKGALTEMLVNSVSLPPSVSAPVVNAMTFNDWLNQFWGHLVLQLYF